MKKISKIKRHLEFIFLEWILFMIIVAYDMIQKFLYFLISNKTGIHGPEPDGSRTKNEFFESDQGQNVWMLSDQIGPTKLKIFEPTSTEF